MSDSTTTTTTVAPDTTTTTTVAQDKQSQTNRSNARAKADAPKTPSNEEVLDSVATASPHADRDPNTKVLGSDNVSVEESQDRAKREAVANARGEQDLH